jgi:hypothetical protein
MTRVRSFQKPPRRPRSSARWQFCVGRASLRIARRTAAPLKTLAILASFCQNRRRGWQTCVARAPAVRTGPRRRPARSGRLAGVVEDSGSVLFIVHSIAPCAIMFIRCNAWTHAGSGAKLCASWVRSRSRRVSALVWANHALQMAIISPLRLVRWKLSAAADAAVRKARRGRTGAPRDCERAAASRPVPAAS